jgi:hypothetical protein
VARQELYRVEVRADGGVVREDDAEVEPLDEDGAFLGDGEVVAMAVNEGVASFCVADFCRAAEGRACGAEREEGAVATHINAEAAHSLTTTGVELTEGKHYWEVELLSEYSEGSEGRTADIGCYVF